jgi:catechol 2,3-dioxygenase-like lactoylglutathione lyase family enzyme
MDMLIAAHTVIFAEDADRARAFFRDVLGLPNVDAGGGWLIFRAPPVLAGHDRGSSRFPGRGRIQRVQDQGSRPAIDRCARHLPHASVSCCPVGA